MCVCSREFRSSHDSQAVAAPRGGTGRQLPPLENGLPPHLPLQNFPDRENFGR